MAAKEKSAASAIKRQQIDALVEKLTRMQAVYYKRSDIGTATLFSDVYRDKHRYNVSAKDWFQYRAGIWQLDPEGMSAKADLKLLGEALCQYAAGLDLGEVEKETYMAHACKWLKSSFRITLMNDAKDLNYFSREELDKDIYILNCVNGVLSLKDGNPKFSQHKPEYLLSKVTGTIYDEKADCPRWKRFLSEVTEEDEGKQIYLQKIAGLSLVGDVPEHKFFIIYGSTTRNGKSTFTETLLNVLGSYGATVNPETLAIQKTDSRRASGDLARLAGIRLAVCSEAPRRMPLDSALIKKMTGGEKMLARNLNEREFEFQPQFSLLMNTNYLPSTTDSTVFASGRISVCEFPRHFSEGEQDKHLKERLLSESAGILNWMIEGYQRYLREGIEPPETIKAETDQYQEESDRIAVFLSECLEADTDPETYITVKEAYPLYDEWCKESGYPALGKQKFTDELRTKRLYKEKLYLPSRKEQVQRVIHGYCKPAGEPEENPFER